MGRSAPLSLFITVDTELSHARQEDLASRLQAILDRDIHGRTPQGQFGLPHILDRLKAHGLRASFFLEAFYGLYAGAPALAGLVEMIQDAGQEVALHLHTEWLRYLSLAGLEGIQGENLKDFSPEIQRALISLGLEVLALAGAEKVAALRAGNYGADLSTLAAAAQCGLGFETSYNHAYLGSDCGIDLPYPLWQPQPLQGLWEFPVGVFRDYPGHLRPLQLSACSLGELTYVIDQAVSLGWPCLVLVMHSFELIHRRHLEGLPPRADAVMIKKFEGFCQYLAARRQEVSTCHFNKFDPSGLDGRQPDSPLVSTPARTLARLAQQAWRRLDSRR